LLGVHSISLLFGNRSNPCERRVLSLALLPFIHFPRQPSKPAFVSVKSERVAGLTAATAAAAAGSLFLFSTQNGFQQCWVRP